MARFFWIGGLVLAGAISAAPAFAGGFGGHMGGRPAMRGMPVHPGPAPHPLNARPQGYSFGYALPHRAPGYAFGYALPHGRPGYDYGYALPYRGGYYGGGYGYGGGYYYDAGPTQTAPIYLPATEVYVDAPLYPLGYSGVSDTPTGVGAIYNLPRGPYRLGPKIIHISRRPVRHAGARHVTVIRGGAVTLE
ncbi:hypothetical protein [Rhodoblastus sp.]|uniref:hypothetical protein n=1 Tax=Rhodoblastus sp. TaxID=1962975 RepID=UPI003F9C5D74